ncbi:hypothetical protein Lsan_0558 [Legionella santicrucis]|uniref:Uncharacterized protein n=1 Tax=Legionella santicrucis TaxID=45074 RepID=A0A0W0ZBP6_9GAMM|nr:hypothetical protein [Legionella santicrucis]KTD66613.1 hypothetical protein Lsan_0558 [Legionella santicrucis]
MYQLANKLLFLILTLMSSSLFSAISTPIEITLEPNKPTVLTNSNTRIAMLCEIHAASNTKNNVTINIMSGKGVFNGTTFRQGDFMVWTIYNMQQIPFTADPGTKAQVTNLGSYTLKAVCV